jgi:hypothetical protein
VRARPPFLALALAALLAAPARGDEPAPDAVLADLPFEAGEPNRVIVDLAPEGHRPFPLMLDTGASGSVLTPLLARELGVRVRRTKDTPYRRPTRLGRDLQFWVDDRSSDTGSKTGWEYGLLGGEFLAEYVLEIDFPARRVRFLDRRRYQVPERADAPGEAVLPLQIVSNRPHLEIEVEGRPARLILDTGSPDTAILSGQAVRKMGLTFSPLLSVRGGSVLGPLDLELVEVGGLRLGPFLFPAPFPLFVAPRGWYNQGGSTDSVIGYDLLAPFVLRIDYSRRRLWLRRAQERPITLFGADYAQARRSGVLLVEQGERWYAYLVFPGGRAERLGLRAGDVIAGVEGTSAGPDPELVARAIAQGRGVRVLRRVGDGVEEVALAGPGDAEGASAVGAGPPD